MQSASSWQDWARQPFCPAGDKPFAGCADFLPAMQRRRLSDLARAVLDCVWPLMEKSDNHRPLPLVFVSRHGETSRSFELLGTLAANEPLSPTAFCLSVHNAIAGQWSMLCGEKAEAVALAAEDDGLEQGFMEAALLLASGHSQVLLVVAEEAPPLAYQPWIDDVPFAYVAVFLLKTGSDLRLSLQERSDHSNHMAPQQWPNPLSFLRHFLLGTPSWQQSGANGARCWQWARTL
ncbi:beta-ketoacyl synthase chain length factor [Ventosimonas gracilis]|nr:beta-ketoacyl synthase chain length factor [Ventosimonas gracilis]